MLTRPEDKEWGREVRRNGSGKREVNGAEDRREAGRDGAGQVQKRCFHIPAFSLSPTHSHHRNFIHVSFFIISFYFSIAVFRCVNYDVVCIAP